MGLFRCKIDGESFLGNERLTNCPFCGVRSDYAAPANAWQKPVIEGLSEISPQNPQKAFELEVDNDEFSIALPSMLATKTPVSCSGLSLMPSLNMLLRYASRLVCQNRLLKFAGMFVAYHSSGICAELTSGRGRRLFFYDQTIAKAV